MTDNEAAPGAVDHKRDSYRTSPLCLGRGVPKTSGLPPELLPDGRVKAIWLNEIGSAPLGGAAT